MGTEESRETRAASEQPGDILPHGGHADVPPFVRAWNGERGEGPEGSGDWDNRRPHSYERMAR